MIKSRHKTVSVPETGAPPKKNKLWSVLFVLFNVIAILVIVLMERGHEDKADFATVSEVVWKNIGWFLAALATYFVALFTEGAGYTNLIVAITGKIRHGLGTRLSVVGKYYDNLTPLATGGQPFQVHTLIKRGVAAGEATGIVIIKYLVRQLVFNTASIAFLIFSPYRPTPLIIGLACFGSFCLIAIPLFLVFVGFSKGFGQKLLNGIVGLLAKIRIVKDREAAVADLNEQVGIYRSSLLYLFKKKRTLLFQLLVACVEVAIQFSAPYLVYRAFGMNAAGYFEITTLYVYCILAVSFVPTPGTAGAAEASFYTVFSAMITNGTVFWALIAWRLITFYVHILAGVFLHVRDFVYKLLYPKATTDLFSPAEWDDNYGKEETSPTKTE